MRRRAGVAALLLALGLSGSAALAATLHGSPRGIALFRAENRALSRAQTIDFSSTGGAWVRAIQGNPPQSSWLWAAGKARPGMVRATLHGQIGVRGGRVRWTRVVVTPMCAVSHRCHQTPVTVVSGPSGIAYAFGTLARHRCFSVAHGPYLRVGEPVTNPLGTVRAPQARGAARLLTFSFPWVGGQRITETDTISRATDLPRAQVLSFPARDGAPGFTIRDRYRYGPAAPAPVLTRCR